MKIIADDNIPFLKGVFEPYVQVEYLAGGQINRASIEDASILIVRSLTNCDESLLRDTSVRFIATASIGDDHIDQEYCRKRNILWANAKGCNADAVAQYVTASLLGLAEKHRLNLAGTSLGIIGVGNIGTRMERIAKILGMDPLPYDPPRAREEGEDGFVPLEEIIENSDFITLHVPLKREGKDKTFHLIEKEFFEALRRKPFLINSARGAVVETEAAANALKQERIRGYVADVWENEPNIDRALLYSATITTPHIAGYSVEGKFNATSMVVEAVADFLGIDMVSSTAGELPPPKNISADCKNKNLNSVTGEIYKTICPVFMETEKLKERPEAFLDLRKNYSLRRDNKSLNVNLKNCRDSISKCLRDLEFSIGQL